MGVWAVSDLCKKGRGIYRRLAVNGHGVDCTLTLWLSSADIVVLLNMDGYSKKGVLIREARKLRKLGGVAVER